MEPSLSAAGASGDRKTSQDSRPVSGISIGSSTSRTDRRSPSVSSINRSSHRQSFAENLRNIPPSPRQRQHSLTQSAVQDLLNNPPPAHRHLNPQFANREWQDITVGELVSPGDVKWMSMDSTVEEATMLLIKGRPDVVFIRENTASNIALSTFDFKDLTAYLLVVIGLARPEEDQAEAFNTVATKSRNGEPITLREIQGLRQKEGLVTLPGTSPLSQVVETLGSGVHRFLVTDQEGDAVGIMSQLRMVEFFWNEGVNFLSIDQLYPSILRDLGIGTKDTISVNSDAPLSEALVLMHNEGLTSVAVVDNGHNVVGNISTRDVRHLTTASNAPLLSGSCMHFISFILTERGVENGRDTFPVFYVSPYSTLAHTVAKLVATGSHRMWMVESASPSPSGPATPLAGPGSFVGGPPPPNGAPPSPQTAPAVPASAMMGARMSGRLTGVISLTDILNLFARATGLRPMEPSSQRERRRKSSTSSMRASIDSFRGSNMELRR
ncbi:CBS protein [Geosmithia morbida]|uniref:CBS protein n=1 Tax=Geosmithia morbida TaxID=1094350 RepID=A0A9P4YTP1_9HYPO|nr:CBS protein [Geosmithia morbida]KAF4121612.1 CBS protein [Geosmithia morbida]